GIGRNDSSPGSRPRERFPPSPELVRRHVRTPVREHPSPLPPPSPRRRLVFFRSPQHPGKGRRGGRAQSDRLLPATGPRAPCREMGAGVGLGRGVTVRGRRPAGRRRPFPSRRPTENCALGFVDLTFAEPHPCPALLPPRNRSRATR